MPRPLRLDYAGAWFHLTARGSERQSIFLDDADRLKFLALLGRAQDRFGAVSHAYCLMGNHYHLVLESTEGRLSEAIQFANGSYAGYFNRRRVRVGHLFQGRFHSSLIERDAYLLEAIRYVELNPCRAGLVSHPVEWEWSSFRSRARHAANTTTDPILSFFSLDAERGVRYEAFVLAGLTRETDSRLRDGSTIIGKPEFVAAHAQRASRTINRCGAPRKQRLADRPPLEELLANAEDREALKHAAVSACRRFGYSFAAVGRRVGVHYTAVSRWVRAAECDDAWSDP